MGTDTHYYFLLTKIALLTSVLQNSLKEVYNFFVIICDLIFAVNAGSRICCTRLRWNLGRHVK